MSTITSIDANMAVKNTTNDSNILWYNPTEKPFRLSGFHWFDIDNSFRRLPLSSKNIIENINPKLNALSNNTAGGQIAFKTNSSSLSIKVSLTHVSGMSSMTATGQSGFDCYLSVDGGPFCFEAVTTFDVSKKEYEFEFFKDYGSVPKEIILNFPLYNGVVNVEVGLDNNSYIKEPNDFTIPQPIVFYGTSITQGGCATRPGMAYTNIISRRLNANTINLGFSGNAFGEVEMADIITQIYSPSCIIVDFEANGGVNGMLEKNLYALLERIRSVHKSVPLLVVSRLPYHPESHFPAKVERRNQLREFQRNAVEYFRSNGDENIHYLNGKNMIGDDFADCYVDAIHPTDLGFIRMADTLTPIIKDLINNSIINQ